MFVNIIKNILTILSKKKKGCSQALFASIRRTVEGMVTNTTVEMILQTPENLFL